MSSAQGEESARVPEWVVTFGDMMSLLLTFFIMLFSMSEIKEAQRYQAMVDAMRKRFGYDMSMMSLLPGDLKARNSSFAKLASLGRARRLNTLNGGDKVRAPVGENPRVQTIRNAGDATTGGVIYFEPGRAKLARENEQSLRAIAREIAGKPQKIEIRGHTSTRPLPPDSPYKDHWDLAYARCRNARDFLASEGIDPKRMRIAVAADNEPVHIGNDRRLQRQNPRVEVFMLNEWMRDREGNAEEKRLKYSDATTP